MIAIASVIVGGAAIFGGRGRIIGSCLGAILIGLIDKVLREGVPITRIIDVGGEKMEVAAVSQLPPGAVPAFLGVVLIIAVLIEPWLVRRRALARFWAWLRGRPPPPIPELGGVAIAGVQTRGTVAQSRGIGKRGLAAFFYRRDAAAVMLMIALWLFGLWARPDFWAGLDNTFSTLLAFSEIALLAVGLTFVMANGDIDLSVGSVLALSGAVAAVVMKDTDWGPLAAVFAGIASGVLAGAINGWLTAYVGLPAFIATLGTFYWARGVGSSIVAGTQLNGFPESFNLIGRNFYELLDVLGIAPTAGLAPRRRRGGQRPDRLHHSGRGRRRRRARQDPFGQKVYAIGGNERAANFAGINTRRVRFTSMVDFRHMRRFRGRHLRRVLSQLHPDRGPAARARRDLVDNHRRRIDFRRLWHDDRLHGRRGCHHLDSVVAVAADHSEGRESFVLPQQWQNVFIGGILISAVVGDIWLRQNNILGMVRQGAREAGAVRSDLWRKKRDDSDCRDAGDLQELRPGAGAGRCPPRADAGRGARVWWATIRPANRRLMKILTGAYQRDTGEIFVNGEAVRFKSPHESRDRGIEMIYQDFALCGNLDVGQNIFLGRWPLRLGSVRRSNPDAPGCARDTEPPQGRRELGLPEGRKPVGRPPAIGRDRARDLVQPEGGDFRRADRQSLRSRDRTLLETIVELKNHGVAQIIISHRLTDIFEVGDRVMVLKRGRNVGVRDVAATSEKEVLELIVSGVPETVPDATLSS